MCKFGDQKAPFSIYVGNPKLNLHPLKYQAAWLLQERGGQIPSEVMENFEKLYAIAKENDVSFEELCVYAFSKKEADKPVDTDDIVQHKNGES